MLARFVERVALQGQLWHLADSMAMSERLVASYEQLNLEVTDWFSFSFKPATEVGYSYGLYRVMQAFSQPELLYYYTRDGIGFIFALFPAWLISYGYGILIVLTFFAGLVWGLVGRVLVMALRERAILAVPFLGLLLTMQSAAHIDGMSYRIFGLRVWALLVMSVLAVVLVTYARHQSKRS